jgi:hypothetical protein
VSVYEPSGPVSACAGLPRPPRSGLGVNTTKPDAIGWPLNVTLPRTIAGPGGGAVEPHPPNADTPTITAATAATGINRRNTVFMRGRSTEDRTQHTQHRPNARSRFSVPGATHSTRTN